MDSIEKFKIFCLVAQTGSFIEVARQLDMPRSTITYIIKSLEKEYEVLLFHRTTRQVSLTNEGQLFLIDTKKLLDNIQTLHRFKSPSYAIDGYISMGLPLLAAREIIIPNIAQFHQQYPNVTVRFNTQDSFSNLRDEQLDCVLRVGGHVDDNLIAKQIAQSKQITVASPKYLEQYGIPLNIQDLKQHLAIGYSATSTQNNHTLFHFAEEKINLKSICIVSDTESYLQCALNGLGIIQIPEIAVQQYLKNGTLIEILADSEPSIIPIQLVITHKKYRPQYRQDFLQWVEDIMQTYCNNP